MMERFITGLVVITVVLFMTTAYAAEAKLKDGAYKGKHSFVEVVVTIENGGISDIEMLEHGGGGKEYADMVEPLIGEMIQQQSTEVDAVTGATISSDNLKKAVDNALEKAR